jgi:hypothetical protein
VGRAEQLAWALAAPLADYRVCGSLHLGTQLNNGLEAEVDCKSEFSICPCQSAKFGRIITVN